jgi:hypothetical protein
MTFTFTSAHGNGTGRAPVSLPLGAVAAPGLTHFRLNGVELDVTDNFPQIPTGVNITARVYLPGGAPLLLIGPDGVIDDIADDNTTIDVDVLDLIALAVRAVRAANGMIRHRGYSYRFRVGPVAPYPHDAFPYPYRDLTETGVGAGAHVDR